MSLSVIDGVHVGGDSTVNAYTTDRTPYVSIVIGGVEHDRITSYSYDSDLLQLGDPAAVSIPIPSGAADYQGGPAGFVELGDIIKIYMSDPDVAGGKKILKMTGRVLQTTISDQEGTGTVLNVGCADLGWHLTSCEVPYWKRLEGKTFQGIYDLFVHPSWGFAGFRSENDTNTRVKLGGSYTRAVATLAPSEKPPIIQTEPGSYPADYLIEYAKLANMLVNVSSDGYLQLFAPSYTGPIAYKFYHYAADDKRRNQNNIKQATLGQSIDSLYTKCVAISQRTIPLKQGVDPNDPNANSIRASYTPAAAPLPFYRLNAYADGDRTNTKQLAARAAWKFQRGLFDSWTYEITVRGHSQGGLFYEPDTMCEVHDTVCGVHGSFYVTAVRYMRSEDNGTETHLTIKKPKLLAA